MKEDRRNNQKERESVGKSEWNTTRHRQIKPVIGRWQRKKIRNVSMSMSFSLSFLDKKQSGD